MFINKIGKEHLDTGRNCQDYGMDTGKMKLVCDGCSEGAHTEVGAKAFVHLTKTGYKVEEAFERLIGLFGQTPADVRDYLCFTILQAEELEDGYQVQYCGDGYVILQDLEGKITFMELSDGEYPRYFAYNYVSPEALRYYKDGVKMKKLYFSKKQYQRVGVATDDLRYVLQGDAKQKEEFLAALQSDKEARVKRFVNKYQSFFKDDLTIAW